MNELGLNESVDTLSRWMAHYVAELIESVEGANADERPVRMRQCAEAILNLWKHRRYFPDGKRPLEDFELILRALESLDPDDETPRYFRHPALDAPEEEQNAEEAREWLKVAEDLDRAARILIRYCLACAGSAVSGKSRSWATLAEAAGLVDDVDLAAIRFVGAEIDLMTATEADDKTRKRIEDLIGKLESFRSLADALTSDLKAQLRRAGESEEDSQSEVPSGEER